MQDIYLIGMEKEKEKEGYVACSSEKTKKQIEELKKYSLDLFTKNGEQVTWNDIDSPEEPRTILRAIVKDREIRIDKNTFMADRPSFAVCSIDENRIVRLEYYEGHDALKKEYDIRSKELQDQTLSDFLESDPQAYDPYAFLEKNFGIPKEISKPILDKLHNKEHAEEDDNI